jgi:O-6-methylguanine DNA methyltransferase
MHRYSDVLTEIGKMRVACSSKGITVIDASGSTLAAFAENYQARFGVRPKKGEIPGEYGHAVMEAAAGRAFSPVPLDLSGLTGFQQKVLKILQRVPSGEVRTYAWLARKAGRPAAARAVGNTMARNPIPFLIPCHRVVPAAGGVGNYGLGSKLKRELLQREGVAVDRLQQISR